MVWPAKIAGPFGANISRLTQFQINDVAIVFEMEKV
jgi:hypothetical protein